MKIRPIIIDESLKTGGKSISYELGFLQLSTPEQIAKSIYHATGDKIFKGFFPLTWNTSLIIRMQDARERLTSQKKRPPTARELSWEIPTVSEKAHEYFLKNADKIKGWLDKPSDILRPIMPLIWISGIGVAAYLLSQIKSFIPKNQPQ